ncbi:MAG: cobyric acid synthase, partial [Lachnospiraceae bacterium]|nr:cobyric acid synthase [Lachnospiraceae bacterium]
MAKSIMVQGTMSNAGKSLIAAGLCRIFKQDGYRVAPFKSQNMALNSYVTANGLEMGRAQVVQAEAAGIAPDVRMNPVLLKPTSDSGSQVVLNGEVLGDMDAQAYYAYKKELLPKVMEAYNSLAEEFDVIVLEGAGSAAEINLKENDIVNMGMAKASKSPVLLAGDIDRGGVFAQLYGTVALLEQDEKDYIKGLLINKFRGDKTLLEPGNRMLEEKLSIPVLGVIPYTRLDIDDEDSLSERLGEKGKNAGEAVVDIAVIRLPHISNFTDLNIFSRLPDVSVRYIMHPDQLGEPDMVVLPGTKNTMGDLKWLHDIGLFEKLQAYHAKGGVVFGICGGYQMLGKTLKDPEGVEEGGELEGLGFFNAGTIFTKEKRRTQAKGVFQQVPGIFQSLSGLGTEGYEIHMGRLTDLQGDYKPFLELLNPNTGEKTLDGITGERVYGTYLHGVFDAPGVAYEIAKALAVRKGKAIEDPGEMEGPAAHKEKQYDLLAKTLRESLDMDRVYQIL